MREWWPAEVETPAGGEEGEESQMLAKERVSKNDQRGWRLKLNKRRPGGLKKKRTSEGGKIK